VFFSTTVALSHAVALLLATCEAEYVADQHIAICENAEYRSLPRCYLFLLVLFAVARQLQKSQIFEHFTSILVILLPGNTFEQEGLMKVGDLCYIDRVILT
jgi:hypothetical protein